VLIEGRANRQSGGGRLLLGLLFGVSRLLVAKGAEGSRSGASLTAGSHKRRARATTGQPRRPSCVETGGLMLVGRARLTNALDDPAYAQPQDQRAAHIAASATGTGWERTPWRATRRAARKALRKANENIMNSQTGL
jgi:hypothetical protein